MAKAFSVASWNVEHFGATNKNSDEPKKPVGPIIDFLAAQNAEVVAIYEVVGKVVYSEIVKRMPGYQYHLTEGPQSQEILLGVKTGFTGFFTQRTEFKAGVAMLRPGALLTLTVDGENYPLLFLHLKSMSDPKGFGLRDDMVEKAIKFRKILNKAHIAAGKQGKSNFLFLGDLNTMGMNLTYNDKDIGGPEEIERLQKRLSPASVDMKLLDKSADATFWPGSNSKYLPSALDHVVAAEHLEFKKFNNFSVDVRGWVDESSDAKKDKWTKKFSDHALLYFEVQKV